MILTIVSLLKVKLKAYICFSMESNEKPKQNQSNDPMHGVKLIDILEYLVEEYGWEKLGDRIDIRCFNNDPSIKSSLKFLRKTPWARAKVEDLYMDSIKW